jgi:hypothetical protein
MLIQMTKTQKKVFLNQLHPRLITFYYNLIKEEIGKVPINRYKQLLTLLRDFILIQREIVAASIIQRRFRLYIQRVREKCALQIQLCYHTSKARLVFKLKKAKRFFNRILCQKMLTTFIIWRNEIKLGIYKRKFVGLKSKVFKMWDAYAQSIIQFRRKIKARKTLIVCTPILNEWRAFTFQTRSVKLFILNLMLSRKKKYFNRVRSLVSLTQRSVQLQNWVRGINAKLVLRRLKLNAVAQSFAKNIIYISGQRASKEFKRRGAVALQKIIRSYRDRVGARQLRLNIEKTFVNTNVNWKRYVRKQGKLGIRRILIELNKDLFTCKKLPQLPSSNVGNSSKTVGKDVEKQKSANVSFAKNCFNKIDVHGVGRVPAIAAPQLFHSASLHLNHSETKLNCQLLTSADGEIHFQTFKSWLDNGVVYESSATPTKNRVGALTKIIRGAQLDAIRMLRKVGGNTKKRIKIREQLRRGQIDRQLFAWSTHNDLNKIFCLNCRKHFCFASDLLFRHLQLPPKVLLTECRPIELMRQFPFRCPTDSGLDKKTKEGFLVDLFGNTLIFEEVQRFSLKYPHAIHKLNTGGLL